MKIDPLQQYTKLRQQLLEEQSQLQTRLNEINQVLGDEAAPAIAKVSSSQEPPSRRVTRRGRRPGAGNTMSLREAVLLALSNGPVARKGLVEAVEAQGYVFSTKNPLNSIGSILYGNNTPVKSKDGKFYVEGGAQLQQSGSNGNVRGPGKKKRTMSSAAKAKLSASMKARWAKRKKAAKR